MEVVLPYFCLTVAGTEGGQRTWITERARSISPIRNVAASDARNPAP